MKRHVVVLLSLLAGLNVLAAPITWTGAGGDDSWHTAANWSGGFVPTATNDVVISVTDNPVITHSTGATTVRSIQCDEAFVLAGGTVLVTTGTTLFNGPTTLSSAGSLSVDGASASITINGPVVRALSNLTARRGARINLPTLTTLVMTNDSLSFAAYDAGTIVDLSSLTNLVIDPRAQFQLYAYSGGVIDAHRLATPAGGLYAYATAAGSQIDLSGFTGRMTNGALTGVKLEVLNGGAVLVPGVTAMDQVALVIRNGGQIPTAQLCEFTRSSLVVYGGTNSFGALTNLIDSDLDIRAGAKVALTNFSRLVVSNSSVNFSVHDAGTVLDLSNVTNLVVDPRFIFAAWAYSGGRIDLRRLQKPNAVLDIYAEGANSVVDLSAFDGPLSTSTSGAALTRLGAVSNGSLLVSNVTSLDRVRLEIRNAGRVPTAQLKAFTRGNLTFYATTNTFTGLTNLDGTSLDLRQGGNASFPGIFSLGATNAGLNLTARDASTVLDLSNVTNMLNSADQAVSVSAYTGARIDLRRLAGPPSGFFAYADGAGAVLDLSGFAGRISTALSINVEVRNNGAIQMPNVTELDGVDLTIRNNGQVATAQLKSLTRARLSVYASTNNFGSLRTIQDSDVEVRSGARLSLSGITNLRVTNGSVQFIARDSGTVLDLSAVTNISVGPGAGLYVTALNGGMIDLRNVTRFSEGLVSIAANDPGSAVDLSGLRYFACPNPNSTLQTVAGGNILFGTEPCLVANTRVDLCASGQLPGPFAVPSNVLALHAQPWRSYLVEYRPVGATNAPWQFYQRVPMTAWVQAVGLTPPGNLEFRATEFVADPPIFDMVPLTNRTVQLILFGAPGKSYRLQTSPNIVPPVTWQPGPAVTLTNSFRFIPWQGSQDPMLFFRAHEE